MAGIQAGRYRGFGVLGRAQVQVARPGQIALIAIALAWITPAAALPATAGIVHPEWKLLPSSPGDGANFGIAVSISGNFALIGALFDDEHGTDSGAAYVYQFDGTSWDDGQKLFASDAAPLARFGRSVSVQGDVALVGAYRDNLEAGGVYVFRYDGALWNEEQKLTASDAAAGDRFGCGVSVSGDVALIGAYRKGETESGAAYVFRFDGSRWQEEQELLADDPTAYDYFGYSVSIVGDRAIVGDECDDVRGVDSGSAFVFRHDGGAWLQEAKLAPGDGAAADYFGHYVSLSGDAALVGASGDDDNGDTSGSAYVFRFRNGSWVMEQKLLASNGAAFDYFGWSVSLDGNTAVVGSPWDPTAGALSGSAHVYLFNGLRWIEESKIVPSDGVAGDLFGYSVSVSGTRVLGGAPGDVEGGIASGSAYIAADGLAGVDGRSQFDVRRVASIRITPNPSCGPLRILLDTPLPATCQRIVIVDAVGRRVRTLDAAGRSTVDWNGHGPDGKPVPAGIYWAGPACGGRAACGRITIVR